MTRALLHLAHHSTRARTWWDSLPADARRPLYRPSALTAATGIPPTALPMALWLLGWDRGTRWTRVDGRRVQRTFWAPPGHKVPRPPRGRPSPSLAVLFGVEPDPYTVFPT